MIPTITAKASKAGQYRELLVSDYTKESLNETLALLWSVIGQSVPKDKDWRRVLEYSESGKIAPKNFNREIIDRIRGLSRLIPDPLVPAMPSSFSGKMPSRLAWLAERTWAYLVLQFGASIDGEYGYLRDIQSLLFLNAVHYLLANLTGQGLRAEHDCLVNAIFSHAVQAWHDDPAHQHYLLSVFMDYLGEQAESTYWLSSSFQMTPPDDHSYLTKGQSLWLDYLEAGRRKDAQRVLLLLERNAPSKYADEIKEMREDLANFEKHNGARKAKHQSIRHS